MTVTAHDHSTSASAGSVTTRHVDGPADDNGFMGLERAVPVAALVLLTAIWSMARAPAAAETIDLMPLYWQFVGYLVAARLQRGRSLQELARLKGPELRAAIDAALASPADLVTPARR
jgi:hypothetical protein